MKHNFRHPVICSGFFFFQPEPDFLCVCCLLWSCESNLKLLNYAHYLRSPFSTWPGSWLRPLLVNENWDSCLSPVLDSVYICPSSGRTSTYSPTREKCTGSCSSTPFRFSVSGLLKDLHLCSPRAPSLTEVFVCFSAFSGPMWICTLHARHQM